MSIVPCMMIIKNHKSLSRGLQVVLISPRWSSKRKKLDNPINYVQMSSRFYKRSHLNLPWPFSLQLASQQTCGFYAALLLSLPAPLSVWGQTGSHWGHDWHALLGHSLQVQPAVCKIPGGHESQRSRAGGQRQCPAGAEGTRSICEEQGEKGVGENNELR